MKNNQDPVPVLRGNVYTLPFNFSELTNATLVKLLPAAAMDLADCNLVPVEITVNSASFTSIQPPNFPGVAVLQQDQKLSLSCGCDNTTGTLCEHQFQTLYNLINREELRLFFDESLRHDKVKKFAADYGLADEKDLDQFFELTYLNGNLSIQPRNASLISVTSQRLALLKQKLKNNRTVNPQEGSSPESSSKYVILRQHKYYRHLYIELVEAQTTKDGRLKNPLHPVNPLEEIWSNEDPQVIKFFTAISRFQNNIDHKKSVSDLAYLNAIVGNPLNIPFYIHDKGISENISAASVYPVELSVLTESFGLEINKKGQFYEINASLKIDGITYAAGDLQTRFDYFLQILNTLCLVSSPALLTVIDIFKGKGKTLQIHQSKFKEFRDTVLDELANDIPVSHNYLKEASIRQFEKPALKAEAEKIIYLSDFGQHISIVPVIRYDEIELPVRIKRQIVATDNKGKEFIVKRNNQTEDEFVALLLKQHPEFTEQLDNSLPYFYLHKKWFLNEAWFLRAFDDWNAADITILGFEEITENKLNPERAKVSIQVTSGLNWFNTEIDLRFGKKKASLKELRQAIKSKSKFVRLDDGTMGIIPAEWLEKFKTWFKAAEVVDDTLRTPRVNFGSLTEIYEEALLSEGVKEELKLYHKRLAEYTEIGEASIPETLNEILRPYQRHGLNWLNFLDDFNFGGCLADDMGLGKSLQIIAFIVSQIGKRGSTTHMIVVPTSLIFNWQAEIDKFAPSLKVHTAYGPSRTKSTKEFEQFDIILTSYGTLVSDIGFFKKFSFSYVFLDESQNIKNPHSQRYMAARSLNSRSKIVITGTPIENNTFDLYGQLSIACPGLLGNLTYFRDVYSSPIDKFGVKKRAAELQRKIEPFILRRTKDQVAPELPEKVEMVIYCEMKPEQRKVYDAYQKDISEYISSKTDEDLLKSSMHVLKSITRLRQICDAPALAGEKGPEAKSSSKIDTLITHIKDKSSGHKILVFSQFVTMLDLIKEELNERGIAYSSLTGQTKDREGVINEFQSDPAIRVFLISLKAGGTGLNLTEANYVYIVDPWWNPAVENQAIDRCHRIGQKNTVVAVRLICPDTVEEKIMKLQQSKTDRINDLIKTDGALLKSLSKKDLLGLLSTDKASE